MRVAVFGATGTIGRATVAALLRRGHVVTCFVRTQPMAEPLFEGAAIRIVDLADPASLANGFAAERFDAFISCMASRTGAPADAWAVDHLAQRAILDAARAAGVGHFILLSAICVQKPRLAFQHAKLAFEAELQASGLRWSIVRPTAYFKSLAGQIDRVRAGKPFLIFGNGTLTACKPISDADLADFIADCLTDERRWDRILPIGGPGPAITPRQQGEMLFALLGREPRFRSVPLAMLDGIAALLGALGHVSPRLRDKAELARIGGYYASESMLLLDPASGGYDADATPSTGSDTLHRFYSDIVSGRTAPPQRGDHSLF